MTAPAGAATPDEHQAEVAAAVAELRAAAEAEREALQQLRDAQTRLYAAQDACAKLAAQGTATSG